MNDRPTVPAVLSRATIDIVAATLLARVPNLVLPIVAARVFSFSEYSVFAAAFVAASAIAACIGESIAATISRESYRIGREKAALSNLACYLRNAVSVAYIAVIVLIGGYCAVALSSGALDAERLLIAAGTLLLVPAYLLPAAITSFANARGLGSTAVAAFLLGVPASIAISFLVGATLGIESFFLTYFVGVLITNGAIYLSVTRRDPLVPASSSRTYWKTFVAIFVPSLLGGPVHGLSLSVLAQQDGAAALATFVAYYPWNLAVATFASMLASYVIQSVARLATAGSRTILTKFVVRTLLGVLGAAGLVAVAIGASFGVLSTFYGPDFVHDKSLFLWILASGVAAACVNATSQVIIATGQNRSLVLCALVHAILYLGLTILFVRQMNAGAVGVAQALTCSLATLAVMHAIRIALFLGGSGDMKGTSEVLEYRSVR